LFDVDFDFEKNVFEERLLFGSRFDTNKPPADLVKAYIAIELKALTKNNPSGFASRKQKAKAKEAAFERLADKGKDGRFIKYKVVEALWRGAKREILWGETSPSNVERFAFEMSKSFGLNLTRVNANTEAVRIADLYNLTARLESAEVTTFHHDRNYQRDANWSMETKTWLGNEFLVWLWWCISEDGAEFKLEENVEVEVWFDRGMIIEDPVGNSGKDNLTHDAPIRMPEAHLALRTGKLPRKAGMIINERGTEFKFTFQPDTFAVSGLKVKSQDKEEQSPHARHCARLAQIERVNEIIDALYQGFLLKRLTAEWDNLSGRIQKWLVD
jgi:hypothetical protein